MRSTCRCGGFFLWIGMGVWLWGSPLCQAGLVGYFKFDGNLQDSSGLGNHGTFYGGTPVYVPDRNGNPNSAIQFDGVDDYVLFGATGQGNTSFAFGGWIKTSDAHQIDTESTSGTAGTSGQKYAFWPATGGSTGYAGAGLSIGTNGISVYEHADGYMPPLAVYNNTIGAGWNHVMVVYDGDKQPAIYLNGVRVYTGLKSPKTPLAPLQIGGGSYGYLNGVMDEVVIFNQPLSSAQIQALYNGASPFNLGITVLNPGFEDTPYPPNYPGYETTNWNIPGWSGTGSIGVNPCPPNPNNPNDTAPFLNGLTPPEGTHVGFIQGNGTLSQRVYGLTPGKTYIVEYYQDEGGAATNAVAGPSVRVDGQTVVNQVELIRTPQFRRVLSRPFTPTGDSALLEIRNTSIQGDNTLLVDKFSVREIGYLVFQDNFDLPNSPSAPQTPAGSLDINRGLAGRQAGYYFGTPYTELAATAPGGSVDHYSQVDFAGGTIGGQSFSAVPDALVLLGGPTNSITRVSPNQNFNLRGIRIDQMVFEFDVDPYISGSGSGDNWVAFRFGDDQPLQSVTSPGSGFGILFRNGGLFEAFNGNSLVGSGTAFNDASGGFHAIRIELDMLEFNGSPATIRAYADGSTTPFFTYTKTSGFLNNYITLIGYGDTTSIKGHGFDNLMIYTASIPEPASGVLLALGGLGWVGWTLRRRAKTHKKGISVTF